jgi:hypothetical protein
LIERQCTRRRRLQSIIDFDMLVNPASHQPIPADFAPIDRLDNGLYIYIFFPSPLSLVHTSALRSFPAHSLSFLRPSHLPCRAFDMLSLFSLAMHLSFSQN